MTERTKKPYGNIYFEKNLPKNCGECPFNYDSISCMALDYDDRPDELERCLDSMYGNTVPSAICNRRYSKCPLRLKREE
jgi:hypothetical protein